MTVDLLPSSRPQRSTGAIERAGTWWAPIFCANCGADGGLVPEENMTFAFYLCNLCGERWGELANTYTEPDAIFWQRVQEEQLDRYARLLTPAELLRALEDASHPLAKLAKDRFTTQPKEY